ncbi:MAG TPA: PAS domain S-box protein, partial [Candidatus Acidoferrales bacterium]|nr:PAS domain S-box protein [Candidatus Acidoferrales bacterium]
YRETGKPALAGRGMFELELQRSDGSRFSAELCVSELREGRRSLFVSTMRDISARRQVEREIQERTMRLNALIASSPLAIVVLDKNQRVQMCNPAFEELFQYRSAEIAGLDLDPLVAPAFLMEEATGMTRRGVEGEPTHAITRRRRKDGSLVDVEIHSVPLLVSAQLEGAYAIYQDQTERNKLKLYEQILPVCCMCGKIRDDQGVESGAGSWDRLEHYITSHTDARLSHTFCPPCLEEYRKREGLPAGESSAQGSG